MSLRIPRETVIALSLFVMLTFALHWKIFLSPLSQPTTPQLLNGFGREIDLFVSEQLAGYSTLHAFGAPSATGLPNVIIYGVYFFVYLLISNANLAYRLWLFMMSLALMYGTFYFFKKILGVRLTSAILASIILLITPENLNSIAQGSPPVYASMTAFVAAIYYVMRFFEKPNLVSLLGFTISTLITGIYPPNYLLEVLAIVFYVPFKLKAKDIKATIAVFLRLMAILASSLFAVMYYALPSILFIISGIRSGFYYALSAEQAISTLVSQKGFFFPPNNYLGMDTGFVVYHDVRGYVSVPLKSLIIQIGYYFMPILISLGVAFLFLPARKRKLSLYFVILYIAGISLYAGANFPSLLLFLIKSLPIPFAVLRSSLNVYPLVYLPIVSMVALLSDYLICLVRQQGIQNSPRVKKTVAIMTLSILFFVPIYFVSTLTWTGDYFGTFSPVTLPNAYQQISNYLSPQLQHEFFRIAIPGLQGIYHTYWAPNNLWETSPLLNFGIPFIYEWDIQPESLVAQAAFSVLDTTVGPNFTTAEQIGIQSLLGLMGVKYVLVQCDIEGMCSNPSFNESQMLTKLGSTTVVRFQNMTLYQNPKYYSIVYIPNSMSLVNEDVGSWIRSASQAGQMKEFISLTSNRTLFDYLRPYSLQQVSNNTLLFYPAHLLNLTVDPAHAQFYARVLTDKHPFVIVLSTNFDPAFQARVSNGTVMSHFRINSFANAWLIIPDSDLIEIRISYDNSVYTYPVLASFLFIVSLMFFAVLRHAKRDKDGTKKVE